MKKLLLLSVYLLLSVSIYAAWGHRYNVEQVDQNPIITIGQSVTMSVEWGEGDWQSSQIGYGTSTDGANWTWVGIDWFEDGEGSNKRCRATITPNAVGRYYYVYKFKKSDVDSHQYGSADWSENAVWDNASIVSYIDVIKMDYTGSTIDPVLVKRDIDSIVIESVAGYEYAITSANGETSSLVFQTDTIFKGLSSNTSYDIYQRAAETDTTNASSLSEKLNVHTAVPTGLSSANPIPDFLVYADQGKLNMRINVSQDEVIKVNVVNLTGRVVLQESFTLQAGLNEYQLSKIFLNDIYIVNVETDHQQFNKKIVIR